MKIDVSALMAKATADAGGLMDFHGRDFEEPLTVLAGALGREGLLSKGGLAHINSHFTELLRNRLIVEDYYRRFPEIDEESLVAPVVIVGLPRTGTTLLQRVLGCDRRFYPMLAWETRFPAPFADAPAEGPDPRIKAAVAMTDAMIKANPDLLAIHPLNALEPDEEGTLLEHSFQSFFDSYADIPEYTEWMWSHDQTPAYAYLKRLLKFVQWQKRQRGEIAGSWVLKTPHHLRQMDVLFKVFPDARIIQTHRDPLQTIPSIGSFVFNLWKIAMVDPKPERAGQQWSDIWARGMRDTMAVRDQLPHDRFHDIWFADTLARPLDVVKGIYDFLDMSFPETTKTAMEKYLEDNSREKRPLHQYSVDYYGLSEAQITRDFAEYRERYILTRR